MTQQLSISFENLIYLWEEESLICYFLNTTFKKNLRLLISTFKLLSNN